MTQVFTFPGIAPPYLLSATLYLLVFFHLTQDMRAEPSTALELRPCLAMQTGAKKPRALLGIFWIITHLVSLQKSCIGRRTCSGTITGQVPQVSSL
jgi:hypothetical protein